MILLFGLMAITAASLFIALKRKKPIFLAVPFASIFLYFLIELIMVPAPFFETLKFVFSLR